MCGIAGIIGRIGTANQRALERMGDAMQHRGPNGSGYWTGPADEHGIGPMLAHRRLSILDLTTAGSQPMVDPQTGDVVVLNGEIYNYQELRQKLPRDGHPLQSSGDTAAMLRTLSLRGAEAIGCLRGMFAFAFWDASQQQLIVARDPLGIKPLYIAHNPDPNGSWKMVFASEVRAILASGLLGNAQLNPRAVASVVWNGFTVTPETAVEGVESVWPGEYRIFDLCGRERSREKYWRMPRATGGSPNNLDELSEVLEDCVSAHLASDVPLGIFLSGGIDSSAVANIVHRVTKTPHRTFTLVFEEDDHNEGHYARQIAAAIGTDHQEVMLTEGDFIDQLEPALDSLDQPSFDALNSYFMSAAVRDSGYTVALVGSGGDELFGGYTSFRDLPRMLRLSRRARPIPRFLRSMLAKLIGRVMQPSGAGFPPQTRWAKLPYMIDRGDDLLSLYQLAYALFLPDFQDQLLDKQARHALRDGLPEAMRAHLRSDIKNRSALEATSVMEQSMFLTERLLRDTDASSMASSIEIRLPLVDAELVQAVQQYGENERYGAIGSKAALRQIGLRGLDPALFDRPKSGFELPFNRWLQGALGKEVDETLRDAEAIRKTGLNPKSVSRLWSAFRAGAPGLYWTRIWAIYAFVRWCHQHRVYCAAA